MAKCNVELDTDALVSSINGWDGQTPPFQEIVLSALAQSLLLGAGGTLVSDLARELECGTSTVVRWARGSSSPMPGVQRLVVRAIADRLPPLRDEAVRRHREAHAAFRQLSLAAQDAMEDGDPDD